MRIDPSFRRRPAVVRIYIRVIKGPPMYELVTDEPGQHAGKAIAGELRYGSSKPLTAAVLHLREDVRKRVQAWHVVRVTYTKQSAQALANELIAKKEIAIVIGMAPVAVGK